MKLNKKTAPIISFALGSIMFTTTAIAQVLTKSGYEQLKDSLKYTAESATAKFSSYTGDISFIVKDNNTVVYSRNSISKVDVSKGANENVTTILEGSKKTNDYNYSDKKGTIDKDNTKNIYYETQFRSPQKTNGSNNPFKEDGASDMEKIADAVVGNLKDAVVVTENSDGSKTLSGSLSESQIPALVNAVVSFQSKNEFESRANNPYEKSVLPKITKDVIVKEVKGNIVTTKEGVIQTVLGSGAIYGKDEKGTEHKVTFELLAKMMNVNSTKVSKPDLTGKKVEKNVEQDYSKLTNPQKYLGKYKTDILIEKDAKFVKIGEKFINITAVDNKGISGRYYEEYVKGYEKYVTDKKDYKFDAKFEKDNGFNATFNSVSESSEKITGSISINIGSAGINFSMNGNTRGNTLLNDQFNKVIN